MENNKMIEYKRSFLDKIKKFFVGLFKNTSNKCEIVQKENSFKNGIVIKQDDEKIRLLQLQKTYKSGEIQEENMSKEDVKKLIELYKKQNSELKEKIEFEKIEIKKLLN